MKPQKPLVIMFIGMPGSGKTYFATRLAAALPAVTLNSDALRLAMFGSHHRIEELRASDKRRLYDDVFGAMEYAARQTLKAGMSVVYDAQMVRRSDRRGIEQLAAECGALPVLVWIRTSKETAYERGISRDDRADSHRYDEALMRKLVDLFDKRTELPGSDENLIKISGEVPFDEQLHTFEMAIGRLRR